MGGGGVCVIMLIYSKANISICCNNNATDILAACAPSWDFFFIDGAGVVNVHAKDGGQKLEIRSGK